MKQKKLIFNFFVNRNCKKLTDSRKRAKMLADNRKRHHPIETLGERVGPRGGASQDKTSLSISPPLPGLGKTRAVLPMGRLFKGSDYFKIMFVKSRLITTTVNHS